MKCPSTFKKWRMWYWKRTCELERSEKVWRGGWFICLLLNYPRPVYFISSFGHPRSAVNKICRPFCLLLVFPAFFDFLLGDINHRQNSKFLNSLLADQLWRCLPCFAFSHFQSLYRLLYLSLSISLSLSLSISLSLSLSFWKFHFSTRYLLFYLSLT